MENKDNNSSFILRDNADIGSVKIANDVIGMIAGLAALEVDGVSAMSGNITADVIQKNGYKKLGKALKVQLNGKKVKVDIAVLMGYGYNIPATSQKVQSKIKNAIENMTGLEVVDVNVNIAGITVANS